MNRSEENQRGDMARTWRPAAARTGSADVLSALPYDSLLSTFEYSDTNGMDARLETD